MSVVQVSVQPPPIFYTPHHISYLPPTTFYAPLQYSTYPIQYSTYTCSIPLQMYVPSLGHQILDLDVKLCFRVLNWNWNLISKLKFDFKIWIQSQQLHAATDINQKVSDLLQHIRGHLHAARLGSVPIARAASYSLCCLKILDKLFDEGDFLRFRSSR